MTFSTSMMASSTSAPTAMAMPPSVMLLMDNPQKRSPTMAARSDNGMARSVIAPARRFARNTKVTKTTSRVPSRSASVRLPSASSMKSDCRNSAASSCMPTGRSARISSNTSSRVRVSVSVFTSGWR